jgi:fibronectin type 3 domain-containing protein
VAGATRYAVYRATSSAVTYKLLTTTTALSYTNKSLITGSTYYYKVCAYRLVRRTKVYGEYSPVVSGTTALGTPVAVKAVTSNYFNVKVSWRRVTGASRYEVHRSDAADGVFKIVGTAAAASYTDKKLPSGATYYYKVRAYRTVGGKKVYGAFSGVVAGNAANITVAAPTVKATRASRNSNTITWGKVSGAARYELYRATSADGTYKRITTTSARSYTNRRLTTGVEYFYKVRAYRNVGGRKVYGGYSDIVSAVP